MPLGVEYEKMKIYTPDRNGEMREVPIEVVRWINRCRFLLAKEEASE
mgnify:CR=1 FL=1